MKFFAVVDEHDVCFAVKQVTSNVINVVEGVEQLFSDLDDHEELPEWDESKIGQKLVDGEWTSPGVDAKGNERFWFDGTLYENVYDDDDNIVGSAEVTEQ